jgi:hypothetical protein
MRVGVRDLSGSTSQRDVGVCALSDAMHGASRTFELIDIARVDAGEVGAAEFVGDAPVGVRAAEFVGDTGAGGGRHISTVAGSSSTSSPFAY